MLVDCFTQAALHNVCVDLCRAEVSVTQHKLHAPEICASFQQMSGERVTQNVRAQRPIDTRRLAMDTQKLPETLACHSSATCGHEQKRARATLQENRPLVLAVVA